jgi:hypothetical protein
MNYTRLEQSYKLGCELATEEFTKTAFLGSVLTGGKFLLGMGHLGRAGSLASKISPHHGGMPLGFGVLGGATAEEGKRMEGFAGGVIGGLGFNVGMAGGAALGKKLFSPLGSGTKGLKRMGFDDTSSNMIQASRDANKYLNKINRKMTSGNFSGQDAFDQVAKNLKKYNIDPATLPKELAEQYKTLSQNAGTVTAEGLAAFNTQLTNFTKGLANQGVGTGSAAAQGAYRGSRMAKNIGGIAGGTALGMAADHAVRAPIESHSASIYSPNYKPGSGH